MTEEKPSAPRKGPKRTRGDKGKIEEIKYDPAVLLAMWRNLGDNPTTDKLHKALNESGLQCSSAWVRHKVTKHNIVALGAMVGLEDETILLHVKSIKTFLTSIGKDTDPNQLLLGLQVRTMTVIHNHLNAKDVAKVDPKWLKDMMDAYKAMGEEVTRSYQKRVQAGESLPLPESKPEEDDKVRPFTRRK